MGSLVRSTPRQPSLLSSSLRRVDTSPPMHLLTLTYPRVHVLDTALAAHRYSCRRSGCGGWCRTTPTTTPEREKPGFRSGGRILEKGFREEGGCWAPPAPRLKSNKWLRPAGRCVVDRRWADCRSPLVCTPKVYPRGEMKNPESCFCNPTL